MTKDEALKMALEALIGARAFLESDAPVEIWRVNDKAITAIKDCLNREALAQPEQEPVAWLITDEKINSLQVDSIQRLIDRARHAHMTDIKLRINGQDEWYQADWLKHLIRATPPQRTWVGLTDEEIKAINAQVSQIPPIDYTTTTYAKAIEAKLKEKNT